MAGTQEIGPFCALVVSDESAPVDVAAALERVRTRSFGLPEDQVQRLTLAVEDYRQEDPAVGELFDGLLALGGAAVAPLHDEDALNLLQRGEPLGGSALLLDGEPSRCHFNSAVVWSKSGPEVDLMTGWALSDDGVWRMHSWCAIGDRVIETTVPRLLYFGFRLTPDEADEFCFNNDA